MSVVWTDLILGRTRHARLLIMGRGPAASHPSVQRHAASRAAASCHEPVTRSRVTGQGGSLLRLLRAGELRSPWWRRGCGECGVLRPTVAPWSSLEVWPGRGEAASTSMTPDTGHRHHLWRTRHGHYSTALHWTMSGGCTTEWRGRAMAACGHGVWCRCLWGQRGTCGSLQLLDTA